MKQTLLNEIFVDPDFLSTMGIQLIAGRNFSNDNLADVKTAFLVNEAAVKQFGWENPIGKRIRYGYDDGEGSDAVIVGVTRNFNIRSLHEKIEPLVLRMQYDSWPGYWLNIKINGNTEETLAAIKSAYEKTLPGFVADCRLLEDVYNNQYKNEEKAYTALQVSTWVIMLISALGIFSLSVYLSTRRTKEFGIRKVLGASINQIVNMQLGYFLKIVLTANVIALPLAWWLMNVWLNKFAYHTNLSIIDFIPVLVVSALLVVISAGYASWRAGRMNPVDAIKTE